MDLSEGTLAHRWVTIGFWGSDSSYVVTECWEKCLRPWKRMALSLDSLRSQWHGDSALTQPYLAARASRAGVGLRLQTRMVGSTLGLTRSSFPHRPSPQVRGLSSTVAGPLSLGATRPQPPTPCIYYSVLWGLLSRSPPWEYSLNNKCGFD